MHCFHTIFKSKNAPNSNFFRYHNWRGVYCVNCTKFAQLILRKISEIVATRCQILRLKCTKFDFGWGSAPDPTGELTALPQTP